MIRLLFLLLISCTFYSCDPGFIVMLCNNSSKDRIVKVVKTPRYRLQLKDSITIADTSSMDFFSDKIQRRRKAVTAKDTIENSYSFVLEKGKRALLQSGPGWPDLNQKIIIDNYDTIPLKKDKRTVINKKLMYTTVTTTIK